MDALPTLRQIRYFAAVAETRHFRRAAEAMSVSQPSLSLQIANLESLLGTRLIERGRGPVTLTPAGREVLALGRRILEDARAIVDLTATMQSGLTGTLRLGASSSLGPYLLPRVVERLHKNYPDLRLYIRERSPRQLRTELIEGAHDLILAQLPIHGADLEVFPLFLEPLLLTVPSEHPLAAQSSIKPADLNGLQVLTLGPEFTLHDQISAICDEHGAIVVRDYEGTSLDALRQMVAMGMGVAFLPQLYAASEIGERARGVVALPLTRASFVRRIALIWRRASAASMSYRTLAEEIVSVARADFGRILRFDL